MNYVIVCSCHTQPTDVAITLWRPNSSGYTYDVNKAGKYSLEDAILINSGDREDFAVPIEIVEGLAYTCPSLQFEKPTLCVLNAKSNWKKLKLARLEGGPAFKPAKRRYLVELYDRTTLFHEKITSYELEAYSRNEAYKQAWLNGFGPDEPAKVGSIVLRRLPDKTLAGEGWLIRSLESTD